MERIGSDTRAYHSLFYGTYPMCADTARSQPDSHLWGIRLGGSPTPQRRLLRQPTVLPNTPIPDARDHLRQYQRLPTHLGHGSCPAGWQASSASDSTLELSLRQDRKSGIDDISWTDSSI